MYFGISKIFKNSFRISEAEVRAETSERAAQRLESEVDGLQNSVLAEKERKQRMEEDMAGLVGSLESI